MHELYNLDLFRDEKNQLQLPINETKKREQVQETN